MLAGHDRHRRGGRCRPSSTATSGMTDSDAVVIATTPSSRIRRPLRRGACCYRRREYSMDDGPSGPTTKQWRAVAPCPHQHSRSWVLSITFPARWLALDVLAQGQPVIRTTLSRPLLVMITQMAASVGPASPTRVRSPARTTRTISPSLVARPGAWTARANRLGPDRAAAEPIAARTETSTAGIALRGCCGPTRARPAQVRHCQPHQRHARGRTMHPPWLP